MKHLATLIAGLLFGFGLIISGMINPLKVQNFLDVVGKWDPSLAFVMAGAVAIAMPGYKLIFRRRQPLFDGSFHLPEKTDVDVKLVSGAAIFGIGWGLGGYCPGPGITALSLGMTGTFVFVTAMIIGMMGANVASKLSMQLRSA